MKKIVVLILWTISSISVFAQKQNLTMQDAVLGLSSNLAVKNLKQLQWCGNSEYFSQVISNDSENVIMTYEPNTFESEVAISLEKMNKDLEAIGIKKLSSFPAINWISNTSFYINHEDKLIRFNTSSEATKKIEVMASLPSNAENIAVHPKTFDVAYTEDFNLKINHQGDIATLTQDGTKDVLYGTSVHRDEFGIDHGLFWSPSGNALAFYRMDQTMVEDYPIINWSETPATYKTIKYPFAGRTSHHVTLGVYNLKSKATIYLQTGEPADQYLTTVTWSPDEKYVYVSILNRGQNHLKLNQYDATSGAFVKTLFEEKNDRYVEPQHELYFINKNPNQFIWWSQRDGFMHLYLFGIDGKLVRQLTKGDWLVNEIVGFSNATNEVIITATKESPLQKNVYAVNLATSSLRTISSTKGIHTVLMSENGNFLIDNFTNQTTPRNIEIVNLKTHSEKRLLTSSNPLENINLATIRMTTIKASDGKTDLYGKLMLPSDFDSNKKYPVIVYLYNGPHVQLNKDAFPFSGNLWYDYLTEHGYIVWVMDGRGSANRGFEFESVVHRQLGTNEMDDQLKGVEYLKSLPFVDANRMGVHGWSFGGFMTTSLMLRHPDVFKCGVAGGPVLDWSMYEVMYTERYMDTPEENPDGYKANLLLDKTKNLKGKLLVIHGTNDDVVVWQHSIKFIKKSVDENVQIDYFVYPCHPHNVRGKNRVHLMQKITDYFDMYLK